MTRNVEHYVLRGGLDLISSPLTIDPGRLWRALNVEPAEAGYRRIAGYERFDGRPSPSDAAYWMLGRTLTGTEPGIGDTITGLTSMATGVLLKVVDDEYVLGEVVGTFQSGENLEDAGTAVATAAGLTRKFGAASIDDDLDYRDLAATARREDIAKVPGEGAGARRVELRGRRVRRARRRRPTHRRRHAPCHVGRLDGGGGCDTPGRRNVPLHQSQLHGSVYDADDVRRERRGRGVLAAQGRHHDGPDMDLLEPADRAYRRQADAYIRAEQSPVCLPSWAARSSVPRRGSLPTTLP